MPRIAVAFLIAAITLGFASQVDAQTQRVQGILVDVVKDETTPAGSILVALAPANVNYALYDGSYLTLPRFSEYNPTLKGQMYGFDLTQVLQQDCYAITFDSFLKIDKEGTYKFYLTSDDGSRLTIGDRVIVNNDGMHAVSTLTGEARLSAGMHPLQLAYFQNFGTSELRLQFEGPGITKRDVTSYLYLNKDVKPSQQQQLRFVVNQATVFETVRGGERKKANFLKEHRGERVDILPVANSDPLTAAKVDILLPLPPSPPAHVKVSPGSGTRPIYGTVVDFNKMINGTKNNAVTIRLHEPPPPVLGTVADVSASGDKEVGFVTLKSDGKDIKFTVPARALIAKWNGFDQQPGSFLSITRGQTLLVYPMPGDANLATKVDIMQVPAEAIYRARHHRRHHYVTFITTPETEFMRYRDGKAVMAGFSSVEIGEEVGFVPTQSKSHIARKVEVFLPPTIFGVITGISDNGLTIKVGNLERVVLMSPATSVDVVENKVATPAGQVALLVGQKVAVFPGGPAPHLAERVAINFYRYVVKGPLVKSDSGSIVVLVKTPADGTNPARESQDTFQIKSSTKIEVQRGTAAPEPGSLASLSGAREVTVRVINLVPPMAERITVQMPPAPTPPPPPHGVVVRGHVGKVGPNSLTVKIGAKGMKEGAETFKLTATTIYELHRGSTREAGSHAELKAGREVVVYATAGSTDANRVEIHLPGAVKALNISGNITAVGKGFITINSKDGNHTFTLTPTTKIELGTKAKAQPADLAALVLGRNVTIQGHAGTPNPVAERIEVKDAKKKK